MPLVFTGHPRGIFLSPNTNTMEQHPARHKNIYHPFKYQIPSKTLFFKKYSFWKNYKILRKIVTTIAPPLPFCFPLHFFSNFPCASEKLLYTQISRLSVRRKMQQLESSLPIYYQQADPKNGALSSSKILTRKP
ncbi:hypothetical protein ACJJIW_18070 [Microbulbifer sp. JMSA004]|uniref:hypothetical protein n=1 Tax=Microbulbifer sp. JMSA004 TaxID=3243370 RepID=UPI0040399BAC